MAWPNGNSRVWTWSGCLCSRNPRSVAGDCVFLIVRSMETSRRWGGTRRDVGVGEAEGPGDRAGHHGLHVGAIPDRGVVAERGVEDAALAVGLGPGDREILVL